MTAEINGKEILKSTAINNYSRKKSAAAIKKTTATNVYRKRM